MKFLYCNYIFLTSSILGMFFFFVQRVWWESTEESVWIILWKWVTGSSICSRCWWLFSLRGINILDMFSLQFIFSEILCYLPISLQDTNFVPANKDQAPTPEGMRGTEVEKRLNGQVNFYIFVLLGSRMQTNSALFPLEYISKHCLNGNIWFMQSAFSHL